MEEQPEEVEPQVTSSDREVRKLARRLRIDRRREALKKQDTGENEEVEKEEEEKTLLQIQVENSARILEKFAIEGDDYVTNVRIASDSREIDRRENEARHRDEVIEQLNNEAEEAMKKFTEIAEKWAVIRDYKDPLAIHEDIMSQKEKCELLIQQKDAIIAMIQDEIKEAERVFTRDQRKQNADINTLAQRIETQIIFMRKALRRELEVIEEVVLAERKHLIEASDKRWEELYKKREKQEIENSENKFELVEEFDNKITQLRMNFEETYRETKIKLENDIEELERELERIKALVLTNSEKLDYNYQILKKREDENIIIRSQQKRRMNKMQDVINDLRKKISDYETSSMNRIKKLKEDIIKMHKNILEVEAKADHFAEVNEEKFQKIWDMNTKSLHAILSKILDTDRVLYEQQMGIDWEPPPTHIWDKKQLPSYKQALKTKTKNIRTDARSLLQELKGTQVNTEANLRKSLAYRKVIKHLLTRISDKSGFLSEKRLKFLLSPYTTDQKTLVRLDHIFQAMGIQDRIYICILIVFFYPYTYCPECQGSSSNRSSKLTIKSSHSTQTTTGSGGDINAAHADIVAVMDSVQQRDETISEIVLQMVHQEDFDDDEESMPDNEDPDIEKVCGVGAADEIQEEDLKMRSKIKVTRKTKALPSEFFSCQYNHPLMISSIYVSRAIKEFVSTYYSDKMGIPTTGARLEVKRNTISRSLTNEDIQEYWGRFNNIFDENRVRIWDALLEGLRRYTEVLKDRKVLSQDVVKLRKENNDLKRLLANYLDHKEFMKPPCANQQENFIQTTTPPYTSKK